jgi:hypothetical protein
MGGKKTGNKNYNRKVLLDIISNILPTGADGWANVLETYNRVTGDTTPRTFEDIRRYFTERMCNRNRTVSSCPFYTARSTGISKNT